LARLKVESTSFLHRQMAKLIIQRYLVFLSYCVPT